jgi:hypothetical protein
VVDMLTIAGILGFLSANGAEIVAALLAVHAAALAIVNLTPTPKDNEVVAKYYRVIEIFAGIVSKLSKD